MNRALKKWERSFKYTSVMLNGSFITRQSAEIIFDKIITDNFQNLMKILTFIDSKLNKLYCR